MMKAVLQLRSVLHICKKEATTCFSRLVSAAAVSVDQSVKMFVCTLAKRVCLGRMAVWTKHHIRQAVSGENGCFLCRITFHRVGFTNLFSHCDQTVCLGRTSVGQTRQAVLGENGCFRLCWFQQLSCIATKQPPCTNALLLLALVLVSLSVSMSMRKLLAFGAVKNAARDELLCKKEGLTAVECDRRKYEFRVNHRLSERITKLYFEPAKYPPPKGEWDDPDDIVFGYLKDYIKTAAELCGSPVVCNGGPNEAEARFQCRHWYRRIEGKERPKRPICKLWEKAEPPLQRSYNTHSCTFTFAVQWDRLGYYILINNKKRNKEYNFGCGWHCCEKKG